MFCYIFLFPALIPARYILAVLGSIAMAIIYGLKVNLSVALVAMLNHTAINLKSEHPHNSTSSGTEVSILLIDLESTDDSHN